MREQKPFTLLSPLLSLLLLWPAAARPAAAQAAGQPSAKQQAQTEKIKRRVNDWGVLKQVSVTLKSGEKLKGRVAEINDESFKLRPEGGAPRDLRYAEIRSISAKREVVPVASYFIRPAIAVGVSLLVILVAASASGRR